LLVPCVTMSHLKTFLGFKVCVWWFSNGNYLPYFIVGGFEN
jgi:hypothetical protein